jgi:UDP-2,3-diacylglucosamine pyrophosphatase LpxH
MSGEPPDFDVIYSISDLHLGPDDGLQPFHEGPALAGAVQGMATRDEAARVALVVNGDIVDFIARDTQRTFDPEVSLHDLDAIARRFPEVFQAWSLFARTPGRTLVFNLGNHDAELGLASHQQWLRDRLQPATPEQLLFTFDPAYSSAVRYEGFLARCGGRTVRVVHGNEVDGWNVIPPARVREAGKGPGSTLGLPTDPINAGSSLVVSLMNQAKRRFRFVDLLKPETSGAVPVLLALDPSMLGEVLTFLRLWARKNQDDARIAQGLLGPTPGATEPPEEALLRGLLAEASAVQLDGDALLEETFRERSRSPLDLATDERGDWAQAAPLLGGGPLLIPGLRAALAALNRGWKGFRLDDQDDTFLGLRDRYGLDDGVLIAGHTHLRRRILQGRGVYLNTGTWMPLIRLDRILQDRSTFREFYDQASKPGLTGLWKFCTRTRTVARVDAAGATLMAADEAGNLAQDEGGGA